MTTSPSFHRVAPRRGAALAGLASILLIAACQATPTPVPDKGSPGPTTGGSGTPSPAPTASPDVTSSSVMLEVSSEGGFINPTATLAALPTVVVYADGRILTRGASIELPDALLPRVSVRNVGTTGAAEIAAAIHAAGLDVASTADPGVSADSGVSVFKVTTDAGVITTRFAANGAGGPGGPGPIPGGGATPSPARAAALDVLNRLLDPTQQWGATIVPETTLEPLGYRIFVAPGASTDGMTVVAWPLPGDLAAFGTPAVPDLGVTGLRSGAALGADAAALGPVLAAATTSTVFTSNGHAYTLFVRPLLPHEIPA
ncbi:MAG: hypothetical protein ABIV26_07225 [Candidatus Limnocylindrales bacterium]